MSLRRLDGKATLRGTRFSKPYALVFGNEGAGLPQEYRETGTSITIPHSSRIDSLNLPVAVSIALYECAQNGIV